MSWIEAYLKQNKARTTILPKILTAAGIGWIPYTQFSEIESWRYVESDKAVVERVLGREAGGKRNILVLNDEAHHAYRLGPAPEDNGAPEEEDDDTEETRREATVWVSGLDRVQKLRGINLCIDLSATPSS